MHRQWHCEAEAFAQYIICSIDSVHSVHTSGAFIRRMSCVHIRYRLVATSLARVWGNSTRADILAPARAGGEKHFLKSRRSDILISPISFISFQNFFRNRRVSVGWWRSQESQEAENRKFRRLLGNSGDCLGMGIASTARDSASVSRPASSVYIKR